LSLGNRDARNECCNSGKCGQNLHYLPPGELVPTPDIGTLEQRNQNDAVPRNLARNAKKVWPCGT
jgi:hypothetical protein